MTTANTPAVQVDALHKTYRDGVLFRRSLTALKGITLQVQQGEIFGLLGPNGAGKTTFVKVLLGIVRRTSGRALVLGHAAGARAGRKEVGYLPENLRVPRHHNALTALSLYGQLSGLSVTDVQRRRDELLQLVGLAGREKDSVRKYSKGMLQRLGLAIALLHDPVLIFMDEPTDGLDPVGRAQVRQVLLRLKAQGKTIFLNSHLLQEVEMVCDRVAILDGGLLRGIGSVEELVPQQYQGVELNLELRAARDVLDGALRVLPAAQLQPLEDQLYRVQMRLEDQDQVDRCVDELRARGVSIVSLARRRLSLEDAFLEVLNHSAKPS